MESESRTSGLGMNGKEKKGFVRGVKSYTTLTCCMYVIFVEKCA